MEFVTLLSILLVPGGSLFGTRSFPASRPAVPPEQRGVVYVVEGIGGFNIFVAAVRWGLPAAGIGHEVREFDWTHGFGKLFKDLQDRRHLLRKADELADAIRREKTRHPERPIYLVAKSGGTGLVLAATEKLTEGTLERIILLSAAVSPTYDLRPALRATRKQVVSFYSPVDQLVLGWGTRHFGTVDRVYGPSAGLRGFLLPPLVPAEDQGLYDRLVQVRWHPSMIWCGNPGLHTGTSMPTFVSREVAPWLKP